MQESNDFLIFKPLMERFGANCSAEQFYWYINDAYHTVEASEYDQIHASMFVISDSIWVRALKQLPKNNNKLRVLDVGSGTGLVGELLNRLVPNRIESLTCVEPNLAMIEQAKLKASNWEFHTTFVNGDLASVPKTEMFDVITIDSVLHHIVNLEELFMQVSDLLSTGGVLITAQDPRRAASLDPMSAKRQQSLRIMRWIDPSHVIKTIWLRVKKLFIKSNKTTSLAEKVNTILIEQGVVSKPLDMSSIYAVTDVHVPGQPGDIGHGIEVEDIRGWLKSCNLLDYFTYQYFGVDWVYLSHIQKYIEHNLWRKNDDHGFLFGSVWQKE
jgi:ubiquinone/menaquinone biosynthesis C-methylase UbiE